MMAYWHKAYQNMDNNSNFILFFLQQIWNFDPMQHILPFLLPSSSVIKEN